MVDGGLLAVHVIKCGGSGKNKAFMRLLLRDTFSSSFPLPSIEARFLILMLLLLLLPTIPTNDLNLSQVGWVLRIRVTDRSSFASVLFRCYCCFCCYCCCFRGWMEGVRADVFLHSQVLRFFYTRRNMYTPGPGSILERAHTTGKERKSTTSNSLMRI